MSYETQIKELRNQGNTYNQIVTILGCSKSAVCYHLGVGQKDKHKLRKLKVHPYSKKLLRFISREKVDPKPQIKVSKDFRLLQFKIHRFLSKGNLMTQTIRFNTDDLIKKFSENPVCYLTGEPINIYKPRTYQFDHIIPTSRGGDNSLENLGICTKQANLAKSDLTPDELLELCRKIVTHLSK